MKMSVSLFSVVNLPVVFDGFWLDRLQPNQSIDAVLEVVRKTNAFFSRHEPWTSTPGLLPCRCVLDISLEVLRLVGCLLQPVVPHISHQLLQRLGLPSNPLTSNRNLAGCNLPLVPRIYRPTFDLKTRT